MRRSKKLLVDLVAAIAAGGVAYYVAPPDDSAANAETSRHDITAITAPMCAPIHSPPSRSPDAAHAPALSGAKAGPRVDDQLSMAILRNQLIVATSAYMHRRGEDVMRCLVDVQLAGPEKLRFTMDVDSSAHQATTGPWRFVEIVDGEPLPASFETCATRALGAGHQLAPPNGLEFPTYRGELAIIYTIPARSVDSPAHDAMGPDSYQ